MKYCKRCDLTLDESMFTKSKSRYDGLQAYCKECMKLYRKEYYAKNKDSHYVRNKSSSGKLRQVVLNFKNRPCIDCGISYSDEPWLMELDHRDPKEKEYDIAYLVKNASKSKLLIELDKCDPVCLICHRRRSAKMFGWKPNRFIGDIVD